MEHARNMVGPQLRHIRNARGLSQPKLAEILQRKGWDVSRDTIAKIEGQIRWVSDFEAAFLADALGVSLRELFPARGVSDKTKEFIQRLEHQI